MDPVGAKSAPAAVSGGLAVDTIVAEHVRMVSESTPECIIQLSFFRASGEPIPPSLNYLSPKRLQCWCALKARPVCCRSIWR